MQKLSWVEKGTLLGLFGVWLSHLVGVFTPEVGFDAVWYHLPVIKAVFEHGSLVYLPHLYQSVNPLFSDLLFGIGFGLAGEFGTKVIAYVLGISLVVVFYGFAKEYLERHWALLAVLVVSTFQVVAWQSSSFYVDVAKALWELCALWALLRWNKDLSILNLFFAGLFFGASLGTKLFSLALLPMMLLLVVFLSKKRWLRNVLIFFFTSLLIPLPFYMFSFFQTGSPWFSFNQHVAKIGDIGQGVTLYEHVVQRTTQLLTLPYELVFARDYTSIILLLFAPFLVFHFKKYVRQKSLGLLLLWSMFQICVWWYLPPLSTRYALSGFITLTVLLFWSIQEHVKKSSPLPFYLTIFLAVAINILPRVYVNYRSLHYLLGYETKETYIKQFFDGHIDLHLKEWHRLEN